MSAESLSRSHEWQFTQPLPVMIKRELGRGLSQIFEFVETETNNRLRHLQAAKSANYHSPAIRCEPDNSAHLAGILLTNRHKSDATGQQQGIFPSLSTSLTHQLNVLGCQFLNSSKVATIHGVFLNQLSP